MNLDDLQFKAYIDSTTRLRWLFLVIVLLTSLMISHLYIEKYSFQTQQLAGIYGHRILNQTDKRLAELEEKYGVDLQSRCSRPYIPATVAARQGDEKARGQLSDGATADPQASAQTPVMGSGSAESDQPSGISDQSFNETQREEIMAYSKQKFVQRVTDNTIDGTNFGARELPLLGMAVPANDFVPVISIFLVIFSIAVWLNLRSIVAIILPRRDDQEFKEAARLFFTFTGLQNTGTQNKIAHVIQYLAIWLPALTGLVAVRYDFIDPILRQLEDDRYYIGPPDAIVSRGVHLGISMLLLTSFSFMSTFLARDIDRIMYRSPLKEREHVPRPEDDVDARETNSAERAPTAES